jgi:hypothetical protein
MLGWSGTQASEGEPKPVGARSSGRYPRLPSRRFVLEEETVVRIEERESPRRWREIEAGSFVACAVEII